MKKNNKKLYRKLFSTQLILTILLGLILSITSCQSKNEISNKNYKSNRVLTPKEKRNLKIKKSKEEILSIYNLESKLKNKNSIVTKRDSIAIDIYMTYLSNYEKVKGLDFLEEYYDSLLDGNENTALSDSILIILGDENYKIKRLDHSQNFYRKLINKNKSFKRKYDLKLFSIITEKDKANEIYDLGLELFNKQEFNKALNKFKAALKKQSDLERARYRQFVSMGLIYLSKKDKTLICSAIESFEKAINISPEIGETYYYNAIAHIKKFDPKIDEIKSLFEKALNKQLTNKMRIKIATKYEEYKLRYNK